MKTCTECGRSCVTTFGPGVCFSCERLDLKRVLMRDGGLQADEAARLARILMERNVPVGRAS